MPMTTISAIPCTQNNKTFYIAVMSKQQLDSSCFISRSDDNATSGFQRSLNQSRANDIAKYLDNPQRGIIPTAIILSAQPEIDMHYNNGSLSFNMIEKGFLVLDGQHRLYGIKKSQSNVSIPVVIFNDLKPKEEVQQFVDINTNQKGVSQVLLLNIGRLTGNETDLVVKQREFFDNLNNNGALAGKLSPNKSMIGKISRLTFNNATKDVLTSPLLSNFSDDKQLQIVQKFLSASEIVLRESKSKKAVLTNSMIFRSLLSLCEDVLERTYELYKNLEVESLSTVMLPLSKLEYDSYTGSSEALLSKIELDMKNVLREDRFVAIPDDVL